jgi:Zn-dependent protease with chaperone function
LGRLAREWTPIRKRPGYVLGLMVTGVVVLLAPVLYAAAIGGVAWAVWWHLTHDAGMLGAVRGRGFLVVLAAYLAPAVAGAALILMLVKPFFAPRGGEGAEVELLEFEEPRLHRFVHEVCAIIGAPAPKRIVVDCGVNAAAVSRGGPLGLLMPSRGLTLVIGLPLAAGMTRRELAGVLAHEFGHFAQASGRRATMMVGTITGWLLRSAYQRDGWDEGLKRAMAELGLAGLVIVLLCELCAWLARLALRALAFVTTALCSYMMRQKEFDADRYEVRLSGSECFERTSRRMVELVGAGPRAMDEVRRRYQRSKELPDNFPAVVAEMARRVTPEEREDLRRRMEAQETRLFSSHPSTAARVKAARRLAEPGLYTDERPAAGLFSDFDGACRKASYAFYKSILGGFLMEATFVTTAPIVRAGEREAAQKGAIARYMGFEPPTWRPVFPSLPRVPDVDDPRPYVQHHRAARERLRGAAGAARARIDAYRAATETATKWRHARAMLDAGLTPDYRAAGLTPTDRIGVSAAVDRFEGEAADAAAAIDEAGDLAMVRLACALSLLGSRAGQRAVPDAAARRARADRLLATMGVLRDVLPMARKVRSLGACAEQVAGTVKSQQTLDAAKKLLRPMSDEVRTLLDDASRRGGEAPDPYGAGELPENLGYTLVGATPPHRDFGEVFSDAATFVDRATDMYARVLGELVEIAEGVERALAEAAKAKGAAGG